MSQAAKRLRLGQPTVSRRLAELERQLGYALIERSVSGVALTDRGERLVGPARNMATWAAEVERIAEQGSEIPRGPVRITAPPGVAFESLAPFAATLRKTMPQVRLEDMSSIRYADLARRETDLDLGPRARGAIHLVSTKSSLEIPRVRAVADHIEAAFATAASQSRLAP